MKIMASNVKDAKGTSFMEDYTYNFMYLAKKVFWKHICLRYAQQLQMSPVSIKVCPLSMGNRRSCKTGIYIKTGSAVATSLVDLGNRFRLIINAVDCKEDREADA